jgi:ATP/ADP translocase
VLTAEWSLMVFFLIGDLYAFFFLFFFFLSEIGAHCTAATAST